MELRVNIPNSRLAPNPVLSNLLALELNTGEGAFFVGGKMQTRRKVPVHIRFWNKVDISGGPTACWIWTKGLREGYGHFWMANKDVGAHRVAYELEVGPIPEGLTIDHLCNNPPCVNPAHMEVVPSGVNTLRSPIAPATINSKKTHCPNGHPYSGENLRIDLSSGFRQCRECRNRNSRKYYWRQKNITGSLVDFS